jgi:hypothetical protein
MPKTFLSLIAAIIIAPMIVVLGSAAPSSAQTNAQRAQRPARVQVHQEPCWQQAGISKDVIDQRKAVEADTHSQVQAVCADTSLNDQQKKQKIHEIHQESKQKVAGLMTEQQQQELQSCQKERAANHPAPAGTQPGMQHGGGGPCGSLASSGANNSGAPQNSGGQNPQATPQ